MENRLNNRKMDKKDNHQQIELMTMTLTDHEMDGGRQEMSKDVDIQNKLTAIMVDDHEKYSHQNILNIQAEIESDSTQKFDEEHMYADREETLDQKEVVKTIDGSDKINDDSMKKNRRVAEDVTEESNFSIAKIFNDVHADLSPIVGYADEPLLPLSKACAPLNNILHNLSFYVQLALEETPEQPLDGLTIDESAAIRLYTMEWDRPHRSLYSMLNFNLKKGDREDLHTIFQIYETTYNCYR